MAPTSTWVPHDSPHEVLLPRFAPPNNFAGTPNDLALRRLAALVAAAREAGIDETTARVEGEALAATVSERSKGAFVDWAEQTGRARRGGGILHAAKQGNRFRGGPTPLMTS